jgi:1,4-alpha-glucan branching enzyme
MVRQLGDGRTEFRFYRPDTSSLLLAGDFNRWEPDSRAMRPAGDGWWCGTLDLPPGCYQFRYLADGIWYTDFAAFGVEHGPYGLNAVIRVEDSPTDSLSPDAASTTGLTRLAHISESRLLASIPPAATTRHALDSSERELELAPA